MCGIFGIIPFKRVKPSNLKILVNRSMQRGLDSSGFYIINNGKHIVSRASFSLDKLINQTNLNDCTFIACHTRLITNSSEDNQPVKRDSIIALHNGIIINHNSIWEKINSKPKYGIDSEIIPSLFSYFLKKKVNLGEIPHKVFEICEGSISCALIIEKIGKLVLLSNTGSLYFGEKDKDYFFASERYTLDLIKCKNIEQIKNHFKIIDIQSNSGKLTENSFNSKRTNYVPSLNLTGIESSLLKHEKPKLLRCKKCILPETMPFINFDNNGICNYCKNYKFRNKPKPFNEFIELVKPYRNSMMNDCIIPFSGGRDSSFGLHIVAKELDMKPVTFTYDWGMITDLGRRNISRLSSILGIENIIVAADLRKKRENIKKNLFAWLDNPNLGMVSILTAGDKHFFKFINNIKKQTGISLNLWGINPLEVTHFKSGFLGIPPDFEEKNVYTTGGLKQAKYQILRFREMMKSPKYFNRSLYDTFSGEYYRSIHKKIDYFHIYDYWRWDEQEINRILKEQYDWEIAPDTSTTWRIGDGTAAFYNYIYYTIAGFTEHDTFRSNQIREGEITREEALSLVEIENIPRYPNIKWYLDVLGLEFEPIIKKINSIPSLFELE